VSGDNPPNPIIAIVGPTASGKSTLGIMLALKLRGEIINCDSVQVYKGIQIATAKVPPEERQGVPHHLIDFVPPEINYTAGDWAREATNVIEEIENRGRLPILVGGTGLYLRALRQPFFPSPPTDEKLRKRLNKIRERRGSEHLYRILERLDAEMAEELYPRDWPRVQRAIEVRLQTGLPMSEQMDARPKPPGAFLPSILPGTNSTHASTHARKSILSPVWCPKLETCLVRASRPIPTLLERMATAELLNFWKDDEIFPVLLSKPSWMFVIMQKGS
jgi:tRNA A37 N6-isopentenylltransferase MiaA